MGYSAVAKQRFCEEYNHFLREHNVTATFGVRTEKEEK